MTFDELKADAKYMRDGNEDDFPLAKFSDTDLEGLMFESAKRALKLDLLAALNLKEDDINEVLNTVTELNHLRLQTALGNKQLEIYFLSNDRGERFKYQYFVKQYAQSRSSFSTLQTGRTASVGVTFQNFMR